LGKGLGYYILIRGAAIIPTIIILYTIVFIVLRVIPGDPVLAVVGTKNIPPEELAQLRHMAGLDKPLIVQYFSYLIHAFEGDFGKTLAFPRGIPISTYIKQRFPATLELTIYAFLVSVAIGLITGSIAAVRRGTKTDTALKLYSIIAYTLFIPWFGLILQYIFSVKLGLLPVAGRIDPNIEIHTITGMYTIDSLLTGNWEAFKSSVSHLILPSLTLGIVLSSAYTRLLRNNLVDILSMDFIRSYKARGVRERKILLYAIKNAFLPVVTLMGLQFAILLGGAVLTETTFSWPGMGTFIIERIDYRDYASIQGAVIFFAFLVGLVSLIVDIVYALLDPRVRY
jgi:peptide/nickel transport system permease protein